MMADIDELERSLEARKQARTVEIAAACVLLDKLQDPESSVLHGFYIKQESTASIARRLKYQDSYIRKVKINGEKSAGRTDGGPGGGSAAALVFAGIWRR